MPKNVLRATGGLNRDVEPYLLPQGDYTDARNISIDTSPSGGAGAVKTIQEFGTAYTLGIPLITGGSMKALLVDNEDVLFFLIANTTQAVLFKKDTKTATPQPLVRYTHGVTDTEFYPDLKKIGDVLVWNYHNGGTPLSWYIPRPYVEITSIGDLTLIKPVPRNLAIAGVGSAFETSQKEIFKENGFQYAARYVYDSGEVSALSPISDIIAASNNPYDSTTAFVNSHLKEYDYHLISTYTPAIGDRYPKYAKYIEIYARAGNEGIWRRCHTFTIGNRNINYSFNFTGELFEALESEEANKLFDTIPIETKTVEVANNRVFLGNNIDDLPTGSAGTNVQLLSISVTGSAKELTDSTGASYPISYLRYDDDINNRVFAWNEVGVEKPYTNASQYKIGVALYDEYFRTRGVEDSANFQTGNFTYPLYPRVTITRGDLPSWAKYYQVLVTKNIAKDFSYEGYASGYWWLLNDGTKKIALNSSYRGDVKYFVIDISGMIQVGHTYTFQADDRININLATATNTTPSIVNMKVAGQVDNLIYIEWSESLNFSQSMFGTASGATGSSLEADIFRMFFEIYSPRDINETQLFYEVGKVRFIQDDLPNSLDTITFDINDPSLLEIDGDMNFMAVPVSYYSAASITSDDNLPDLDLSLTQRVLIRKVNRTTRNSNWDRNLGKVLIEVNGKDTRRSESKIKYGGKYIQNTNINPISSFSFTNEAEVPYENGPINSLKRTSKTESDGDIMLAICERETTSLYIGESVLSSTTGDGFVSAIQSVIGTVRNLKGGYGTQHPRSVVQYGGNVYFWDGIKKKVVRYGANGLTPISDFFMKSYFLQVPSNVSVVGAFDPFYNNYIIDFGSSGYSAVGFNENRNRWISFYSFNDMNLSEIWGDRMIYSKDTNNTIYESSVNETNYLLGEITYVMNTQLPEELKNIKMYTNMNVYDYTQANNVKSELIRVNITNEKGQATALVESNYMAEDKVLFAHILRSGTGSALINGPHMIGSMHNVKLSFRDTLQETRLNNVIIETDLSRGHLT